jgi:hypothetical protein
VGLRFPDNADVEEIKHLDFVDLKKIPADVLMTLNQTEQTSA